MVQNEVEITEASSPGVGDLLGAYRLTALLGEGGMAKVFAAEHVSGGQQVAVKVLGKDRAASSLASRNFAFEAAAAQRIAHPNVITIVESGEHESTKFHVMERVSGVSLRDLMEAPTPISVPRVMRIARELAAALAASHQVGIVHRDLKPENVMVDERDGKVSVKLIDFGAAKDLTQPTVAGESIVGTPIYMAPEQMWGQTITAATDVYAFGLLVYEMLADRLPFKARKFVELRDERSTQEPTPLRVSLVERLRTARARVGGPAPIMREAVPAELEALIMTCLARSPDERPASMGQVLSRLTTFDAGGRVIERRVTLAPSTVAATARRARPVRRLRQVMGYAAAMVAIFASASASMSDMHARGPRDGTILVASR